MCFQTIFVMTYGELTKINMTSENIFTATLWYDVIIVRWMQNCKKIAKKKFYIYISHILIKP